MCVRDWLHCWVVQRSFEHMHGRGVYMCRVPKARWVYAKSMLDAITWQFQFGVEKHQLCVGCPKGLRSHGTCAQGNRSPPVNAGSLTCTLASYSSSHSKRR